jgi:hypothetical protein
VPLQQKGLLPKRDLSISDNISTTVFTLYSRESFQEKFQRKLQIQQEKSVTKMPGRGLNV